MLRDYEDLTSRLGVPKWYDDNGVPRYDEFNPNMCGVYDDYVALLLISCQSCGEQFKVASCWDKMSAFRDLREFRDPILPKPDNFGDFGYGDPPRHGGMCSGNTMMSNGVAVLEFWKKDFNAESYWVRMPQYEVVYVGSDLDV